MARTEKTFSDLIELLNTKAIYSAASGKEVTFVEALGFFERANQQGVYSDTKTIIDNTAGIEEGLDAMFAVKSDGEAESLDAIWGRLGRFERHPNAFYRNVDSVFANREDVTVTAGEDDDTAEYEAEKTLDLYTNESFTFHGGLAVALEEVCPAEVFTELIRRCGVEVRDDMIEFMATSATSEVDGEEQKIAELFYRISGGDAWFRAQTVIPNEGADLDDVLQECLGDIINAIDWERIMDSAPQKEPVISESQEKVRRTVR